MQINLQNIEERIFYDKKLQTLLPEFRHLFDQWQLGYRIPGMKTLGQRSIFELLNSLQKKHIVILEEYFGDIIIVDKLDHHLTANHESGLNEVSDGLCQFAGYLDFCVSRNKDNVYISFWR